jgi:hypothetical protein
MLEWATERLLGLIPAIQNLSRDKRELRDNALRALVHALNETMIYYRHLERGKQRNDEVEDQLARYWSAASIPLRHIDPELASRCHMKAQFWIAPEEYSSEEVERLGITLAAVKSAYTTLLSPGMSYPHHESLSRRKALPSRPQTRSLRTKQR